MLADVLIPVLGWAGAATSATAYGLVSLGKVASNSVVFQAMNLGGAAALSISAASVSAWPSAAVNVIWLVIGMHSLLVILRSKRHGNAVVDAIPAEPGAVPAWTQPIEIIALPTVDTNAATGLQASDRPETSPANPPAETSGPQRK